MQDFIPRKIDINGKIDPVVVKQYDNNSRFLHVKIFDNDLSDSGDTPFGMEGCTTAMYIKPEGDDDQARISFVPGEVADPENGIVTFLLPGSVTQIIGRYECEIWIYQGDENTCPVISTKPFILEVEKSIRTAAADEAMQQLLMIDEQIVKIEAISRKIGRFVDSHAYPKPIFASEISGYAAQSMISIVHDGKEAYLIGFSKTTDAEKSLLMLYDPDEKTILASQEYSFGHVNSMAVNADGVVFTPKDDGTTVYRFTVDPGEYMSILREEDITLPSGWIVSGVFCHGGIVYAYGTIDGANCYWNLETGDSAINIVMPTEQPRVGQSWSTDGQYLYILRSNPNAMAVYEFASGAFLRWVNIGAVIGGTFLLGEIESICFTDSGAKLLSQYYYPDLPDKTKRYWLISDLKWSSDIVPEQQFTYPNEKRRIYVSNELSGNIEFRTNQGDIYPKTDDQTGSAAHPYPTIEMALYAAMSTPGNKVEIVVKNTGTDYKVNNLVLSTPSMSISISCKGNVLFERIELSAGSLTITENATIKQMITSPCTSLTVNGGTFSASDRINAGETSTAPYITEGTVEIVNAKYTGGSSDVMFEFKSGTAGIVGFTEGSPVSTNYQQTNITLLGVRNAGGRDKWTEIFSGGTVTVGSNVPLTQNIINNAVYRIRWRTRAAHPYTTTIVSVSGDTRIELLFNTGATAAISRVAHLTFNSSSGTLVLEDMREYTLSAEGSLSILSAASGEILDGWEIASVEVKL